MVERKSRELLLKTRICVIIDDVVDLGVTNWKWSDELMIFL